MFRNHTVKRGAVAVLTAAMTLSGKAPVGAQVKTLTLSKMSGGLQKRVPVSGGVSVGVMALRTATVERAQAVVALPKELKDRRNLCVEVSSSDGQYSALFSRELTNGDTGVVRAALDDDHIPKISTPSAPEVVVLASLSDNCQEPRDPVYLVSAWVSSAIKDEQSLNTEVVSVLVNSRVPTSIRIDDASLAQNASTIPCVPLDGVTTAFNLRCNVPRTSLKQNEVTLSIVQKRGRSENALPLKLRVQ